MRIIAGALRGRNIETPPGLETRPILERVKAPLFDWLGSRLALPGSLPALNVCDLFCGAGTHGIEALSRGARHCVFVERQNAAAACLRRNLTALKIQPQATVVESAVEFARIAAPDGDPFGIVFLDPPFEMSESLAADSPMDRVLQHLAVALPVAPTAVMTWRHDEGVTLPEQLPGSWRRVDRRVWRRNAVTFYGRADS